MTPKRTEIFNNYNIEEFYWNGGFVVYINNHMFEGDFNEAIEYCRRKYS